MRQFSSYGPPNLKLHIYAPRTALVEQAYQQLIGEDPEGGGTMSPSGRRGRR